MLHILLIGVIVFIAGMAWGAFFMLEFIRRSDAPSDFANAVPAQFDRRIVRGTIPTRATQVGGDHYRSKAIQPWDAMESWMSPEQFKGFLRGNAIKYLARCDDKGGIEDIKKAEHYLAKILEGKKEPAK
jgi:hypothetical protein